MTGTQSRTMPLGLLVVTWKAVTTSQALERTGLLLALAGGDDLAQQLGLGVEVEGLEALLDRRGAHAALEVETEAVTHLAVEDLVALEVLDLEVLEPVPDLLEALDLLVGTLADVRSSRARRTRGPCGGRRPWHPRPRARRGRSRASWRGRSTSASRRLSMLLLLDLDLRLERGQVAVTLVDVDGRDHVGREVDDLLEVLRGQVEQVAQAARDTLEVPDVGDGGGELDVAHPLTTHLGAGHLDAAALTDDALEADPLVLAAVALPVPGRAEDLLAEEPSFSGLRVR